MEETLKRSVVVRVSDRAYVVQIELGLKRVHLLDATMGRTRSPAEIAENGAKRVDRRQRYENGSSDDEARKRDERSECST